MDTLAVRLSRAGRWAAAHRRIVVAAGAGLVAALAGGLLWAWLRPLHPECPNRAALIPLWNETRGLSPTRLETCLPNGARLVIGLRDADSLWQAVRETPFAKSLKARANNDQHPFRPPPDWLKIFGPSGLIALYPNSDVAGTGSYVVMADAREKASEKDLHALIGPAADTLYIGRVKDVWVITPDRVLAAQAGGLLRGPAGSPAPWLTGALQSIPAESRVYAAVRQGDLAFPETSPRGGAPVAPFQWSAVGFRFRHYLWAETWGQPRSGMSKPFSRAPPRRTRFPFPYTAQPSLFFSYRGDLQTALRTAPPGTNTGGAWPLPGQPFWPAGQGRESIDQWVSHFNDEAGLFVGRRGEDGSSSPPMALFARLKRPLLGRWAIGRALRREGWRRTASGWSHAMGPTDRPLQLSVRFRDEFLVVGTSSGVEALLRDGDGGPSPFGPSLAALSVPNVTNAWLCLDPAALADTAWSAAEHFPPAKSLESWKDYSLTIARLWPLTAGYAVNTKEGSYARWVLHWRDASEDDWRRLWDRAQAASPTKHTGLQTSARSTTIIEERDDHTRITIRGRPPSPAVERTTGPTNVQHAMERWLKDPDWIVRRDAAQALGESGEARHLPALTRLTHDAVPAVREAARLSIEQIRRRWTKDQSKYSP